MTPNKAAVLRLMESNNWNASELARRMGISRSEVHRFIHGKRMGGKKFINGLLTSFPGVSINELFDMPDACIETHENLILTQPVEAAGFIPIVNLNNDLVAKIDFANGLIEIISRHYATYFQVPKGTNISVRHEVPPMKI